MDKLEKNLMISGVILVLLVVSYVFIQNYRQTHKPEIYPIFQIPIQDAKIPKNPGSLPNSLREYRAGIHEGIDFEADENTLVLAARDGKVVKVVDGFGISFTYSQEILDAAAQMARAGLYDRVKDLIEGKTVEIAHSFKGETWKTKYVHLKTIYVVEGMKIKRGDSIGIVGMTGYSLDPHLDFTIFQPNGEFLGKGLDELNLQFVLNKYLKPASFFNK